MSLARQLSKTAFTFTDAFVAKPNGPRLLIYHQVGTTTGKQMEVSLDAFKSQLDLLETDFEVVDLESAFRRWDEDESDRLVVLTFDDGYRDTYTTAFPLLQDRGMPFTLYIATEQVARASAGIYDAISPALTWDEIGEMNASGALTVGAHTHTHRDLREASAEQIVEEINISNGLIGDKLGIYPSHFAYPWGYWSELADLVVRDNYESATLGGSSAALRAFDAHRTNRYPVQLSDGFKFFGARVRGGLLLEEKLRRAVRGYVGP
jgi:peptidoglycan/xylan/chitin deacetylase (PgdA/CDA1 family)